MQSPAAGKWVRSWIGGKIARENTVQPYLTEIAGEMQRLSLRIVQGPVEYARVVSSNCR
jgi:hypothetical protein